MTKRQKEMHRQAWDAWGGDSFYLFYFIFFWLTPNCRTTNASAEDGSVMHAEISVPVKTLTFRKVDFI